ncbi:MAG: Na(+)-translocating NADH-quinone reductase subunit A [Chlamydiia bacterium]|nr:Na(+)-translocating NADH-quinone reductase subunit A [Chlamydiia bacterium]
MVHIKVKKGCNIPLGKPLPEKIGELPLPDLLAVNVAPFEETKFRLLVKSGDRVKIGEPLLEVKGEGSVFVSSGSGTVKEVRRGLKRRLIDVVIQRDADEEMVDSESLELSKASRDQLLDYLKRKGLFVYLRQRPFDIPAQSNKTPRAIFVKAVETAPFVPPAELQVKGYEEDFAIGLEALKKLTDGEVHLVYESHSSFAPFTQAKGVQRHTVEGPHPAANVSVHIQKISPIRNVEEVIWTVTALDVTRIGHQIRTGAPRIDRVVAISGPGVIGEKQGFFRVRDGYPVGGLVNGRISEENLRYISGDLLTGTRVERDDYLGFFHTAFQVLPEGESRELLHFFRLGIDKFTASKTYFSGFFKKSSYPFTTNQHGEERAFVTGTPYDEVMPLDVPTMLLVKAVMAEDYDLAEELGLLEVAPEDFALPTFVCPSKIEMVEIIKTGLSAHAKEVLG